SVPNEKAGPSQCALNLDIFSEHGRLLLQDDSMLKVWVDQLTPDGGEGDGPFPDILGYFERVKTLLEMLKARPDGQVDREYVMLASGHGSRYRFDVETPEELGGSKSTMYTLPEALLARWHWVGYSDTIGGDAIIVHLPTWREMPESQDTEGFPFVHIRQNILPAQQ
ncbi:MAG: hypothetical protein AAF202_11965, partial [Pseudomonadota bacterium]